MTLEDHVLELYGEINPVASKSDTQTHLRDTAPKPVTDQTADDLVTRHPDRRPTVRRGVLVAAAAAVLILVVGMGNLFLLNGGTANQPLNSPEPTSPTEIAEMAMSALNDGDIDGYLNLLSETAIHQGWQYENYGKELRGRLEFMTAIGFAGPYTCGANDTSIVQCDWTIGDELSAQLGLKSSAAVSIQIEGGLLVAIGWEDYSADPRNIFISDLETWIASEKPETAAAFVECSSD
ncbi:MAG: hypothetical protein WBM90_09250, partial [Acidimicrobiia bacterium]